MRSFEKRSWHWFFEWSSIHRFFKITSPVNASGLWLDHIEWEFTQTKNQNKQQQKTVDVDKRLQRAHPQTSQLQPKMHPRIPSCARLIAILSRLFRVAALINCYLGISRVLQKGWGSASMKCTTPKEWAWLSFTLPHLVVYGWGREQPLQ